MARSKKHWQPKKYAYRAYLFRTDERIFRRTIRATHHDIAKTRFRAWMKARLGNYAVAYAELRTWHGKSIIIFGSEC